jgi:tetrahydromethanopterin:alpha-L-glutamate ligase
MVRIGVLGSRDSWYTRDLTRAAGALPRKTELQWLSFADLEVSLGQTNILGVQTNSVPLITKSVSAISPSRIECLQALDAVLVRTMPIGSLEQVIFRMDCLQALSQAGCKVINPPRSLEVAIDKWLTQHRLHSAGVMTPPTIACQTREAALAAFERLGGDVLIKPLFGGEGRGILRIQDADMAWRACGTLQQLGQVMYVQQFMDHVGYDIRVLFVGSKMFSIKRIACDGAWRTNLSQGSRAELHELDDHQREVAQRSAMAVGGSVLGVDLLPLRDGRLMVLEVNAVPGWKGLAATLNVDIARQVLLHTSQVIDSVDGEVGVDTYD